MQDTQFDMRRKVRGNVPVRAIFLALALSCLGLSNAWADQTATGWWLKRDGSGAIIVAPCGAALCGTVAWMRTPLDAQGKPKTDIHNPDASLQARPLCGLPMMGGMTPDGSGGWQGGWVYDPDLGKTYKAVMHVAPDGTLRLRGYIGVPLFGRSAVMTRPAAPLPHCAPAASG
jgi:uncharacterized protein (DUF2147 family)